ncbi:hypothetical protein HDU86_001033 [Geranomyces michiganensis]|nr:hypothetical protein HDU86_001033 [Geranomyces michiganensis]
MSTTTTTTAVTSLKSSFPPAMASSTAESPRPLAAVIGSGLAGLASAYLLARNGFRVHLYEKAASLGLAQASVTVTGAHNKNSGGNIGKDGDDGAAVAEASLVMDVPMRSFFPEHYEHLAALYDYLNIKTHVADNSISFSSYKHAAAAASPPTPYFSFSCYRIPFIETVLSYPNLFSAGVSPVTALMTVLGYLHFLLIVKYLSWTGTMRETLRGVTLDEFWKRYSIRREFVHGAFVPLFCGVCTCDLDTLGQFPAVAILEYVCRAMPFGKMSFVTPGVQTVCDALSKPVEKVFLNTTVTSVHAAAASDARLPTPPLEHPTAPAPSTIVETSDGEQRHYDEVIFATQASHAAKILRGSRGGGAEAQKEQQCDLLERFEYVKTLVTCHTDEALMPADRSLWRCMNFFTHVEKTIAPPPGRERPAGPTIRGKPTPGFPYETRATPTCSHYFNMSDNTLSTTRGTQYIQTTNPYTLPDPQKTISTSWFDRVVVTADSARAVEELHTVQGLNHVWFVGSWAWEGIPLLEGCVASSVDVVKRIVRGPVTVPWLDFAAAAAAAGEERGKGEEGKARIFRLGVVCLFLALLVRVGMLAFL